MSKVPPSAFEDEENPYRAPKTQGGTTADALDVANQEEGETVRRAHLKHEAKVKAAGWLMIIYATFVTLLGLYTLAGAAGLVNPLTRDPDLATPANLVGIAFFSFGLGVPGFCLGAGLQRLRPWARRGTLAFMGIQAIFSIFLFNLIIFFFSKSILYLTCSSKRALIFSPQYKEIIAQTPHLRAKIPIVGRILLVVLFAVMLFWEYTTFFAAVDAN